MKGTTLLLVAGVSSAFVLWSDRREERFRQPLSWSDLRAAYESTRACEESGVDPDVCGCMAEHVRIASQAGELPAVSAGPAGRPALEARLARSRESCERWAGILGLLDDSAPTPDQ